MKKLLLGILAICIIIAAIASAFIVSYKSLTEKVLGNFMGAEVKIGHILFNPIDNELIFKNFNVYNPPGFNPKEVLAHLPEIRGTVNRKILFRHGKLHFTALKVYMKTLAVTKDKDGIMNVDRLKFFNEDPNEIPIEIDKLTLTVDEVIYKQISKKGKSHVEIYAVGIKDKDYNDLPSVEQVVMKILLESLSKTAIKGAAIYGIVTAAGVTLAGPIVLPAGAAILIIGKDSYTAKFDMGYEAVYEGCLEYAKQNGKGIHENKKKGIIRGSTDDASVVIKVTESGDSQTTVRVSARAIVFPRPRIAGAVLYEISQHLTNK